MADLAHPGAHHRRRLAGIALAAATLVGGAVLFAVAPGMSVRAAPPTPTPAPPTLPVCPTPLPVCTPAPTPTATASPQPSPPGTPPPTHSGSPPPASPPPPPPASSGGSTSTGATFNNPSDFPTPPPPLPPSPPGAPPQPPELEVQSIVLSPATAGPVPAGSTVAVQATMEAKRGADLYSVPHAPVTFSIISASGQGARVTPTSATADETGTVVVNVVTGDQVGDTVVGATSGAATAQLTLHGGADTTLTSQAPGAAATGGDGSSGVQRPLLIASLAAVSAAVIAGLLARSGRLPGFRGRRRIWGRHVSS